ncbi:YheC/YheD family protein [Paenibacillus sp. DLE-14]|uniref:YheC/YheD family protein n=2 Tax=Paenibacillus lignilyticus TaxID=1172615 RepID=A0ABS5CGQ8_9BACL|nr:YheC/YheD family protein [Paenibacillus lignilyticus]
MIKNHGFVGLLVANRSQRKNVLNQYLRYNRTNLKLFCFTPNSIDWEKKSIVGLHRLNRKWVLTKFPFPKVVYNRCYDTHPELLDRLGAIIGKDKCFNHINQFNKQEIYTNLSRWLVDYLPETVPFDKENAVHLLHVHSVIYLKPIYGHKGKGVYRVELMESGEIHISLHYFTPDIIFNDVKQFEDHIQELIGSTPYMIQEGVNIKQFNNQHFDIRALVQKNDRGLWSVTNVVSRIAYKVSYNTSICERACLSLEVLNHLYPPDKVDAIIQSVYNCSLRSAEILDEDKTYHLGEFSVDFVLDNDDRIWIIELNGKPQKDLYNGMRNQFAVYERPIQYAHYLHAH